MTDQRVWSPVAFFIFNRPETTARVFAAIRLAQPAKLMVVADGPRADHPDDTRLCTETRAILNGVDWDCEVITNYAPANLGCRRRVSSGLDWVFELVESAIILEDDCLPHPDFFPFCQAMLGRYANDERVGMVSGTNYLLESGMAESYLFSRYFAIWGWATWRRAWQKYDVDMPDWRTLRAKGFLDYYYPAGYVARHFHRSFDAVFEGEIDTWDLQWVFCCLFNNSLSIVPRVNLISNVGTAGTHTMAGLADPPLPVFPLGTAELQHPRLVFANAEYDKCLFEKRIRIRPWERARRKSAVMLARLWARMRGS